MLDKTQKQTSIQGFTIVELMMASAVFSVVLLVALTGFLQIGRLFYKGVSLTQTQDITRQVVSDISGNIKSTPVSVAINTTTGSAYNYYCVGSYEYTYAKYSNTADPSYGHVIPYSSGSALAYNPAVLSTASTPPNFGLVKNFVGSGNCPVPCVGGVTSGPAKCPVSNKLDLGSSTNANTQMLGSGMRIGDLSINNIAGTPLYNVNVAIVYGDESTLDFSGTVPACQGSSRDQKFCAVDQLSTSVYEGELHP